jgi:hypothetical protein
MYPASFPAWYRAAIVRAARTFGQRLSEKRALRYSRFVSYPLFFPIFYR